MALKRDSNDYWSAVQAIAYIGFDALDPPRDWKLINPTEDQRAVIVAAVSELLAQVEAERLAPDWNGERDRYGDAPEMPHNAHNHLVGKASGILNLSGDPFRNLQFKKSEIQALWIANAANVGSVPRASEPADSEGSNKKAKFPGARKKIDAPEIDAAKVYQLFDEMKSAGLKRKYGDLARIGREIAEQTGYEPNTVEKMIRDSYKLLPTSDS